MNVASFQLDRIKAHWPGLEISSVEVNSDGMVNAVVVVNGERVFRFAKHDWAHELMASEALILGRLRDRLTLSVPALEMLDDDLCTYRFLPGEATTRNTLLRMSTMERSSALEQLGEFLTQLHHLEPSLTVDMPASDAARDVDAWAKLYDDVRATLFPHMYRHQRDWVDQHFAPLESGELRFDVAPVLVHGDLASYHVLHDGATRQLTAVIDFGTAGLGDPAVDIATCLMTFGESLTIQMGYADLDTHLPRARFWAGTLELQWALNGMLHHNPTLAVVHIGGARDIYVS